MPAYISTFARATNSARPWWGVGQEIDATESVEVWLQKTKLDYTVQRRKAYMHVAKDSQEVVEIPGYHAITRSSDSHVFQIASDKYSPIQNKEIAQFFKVYTEAGEMTLETMGSLKDGHIIWGLAKIGDGFTIGENDRSESYLLLATAHDGSMAFVGQTTSVRVVCWNTLSAALNSKEGKLFRLKHTKNADVRGVTADAHKKLAAARIQTQQLAETASKLASAQPTRDELDTWLYWLTQPTTFDRVLTRLNEEANNVDVTKLLDAVVLETENNIGTGKLANALRNEADHNKAGRDVIHAMMRSPGSDMDTAKGTWWGAVNGVTYYADHMAGSDTDERLSSSWFGARNGMKENAVNWAMEYATAN